MQVLASPPAIAVRPRARAQRRARTLGPWRVDEGVLEDLARLTAGEGERRRALAAVAGRLVATRACERLGFARLRDYAVERVGVSVRQLQELARVDAALAGLPGIEAALRAGELSWTKARLLCRVATAENEAAWCTVAAGLSARELSREVRQVDARSVGNGGGESPLAGMEGAGIESGDEEPWEQVRVHCSQGGRGRWVLACRVAERTAGGSLPRWACAEAVAAEAFAAVGLGPEGLPPMDPEVADPSGVPDPSALPRGMTKALCSLPLQPPPSDPKWEKWQQGLAEADAFELDARLRRGLAHEQRRLAGIGPQLLRVASERLYRLHGHRSFDAYVRDELALCPSTARALLRVERLACASEVFRRAWRRGRVSWMQAHALAPLLGLEGSRRWHREWIARASQVTVRRLRDDVEEALAQGVLDPSGLADLPTGLQTGASPRRSRTRVCLRFGAPRSVVQLFRAVLARVQRRIEQRLGRTSSEGEAFEAMLEHALESWGLDRPLARKYAVFERDGWRCTVPGCTSYRNLQDHHIRFRSAGGSEALENRTTLCAFHHLRGVHAGRVGCRGRAPERLVFELGLRDGKAPLMRFAAGDQVMR